MRLSHGRTGVFRQALAAMVAVSGVTLVFVLWRRNLVAMMAAHDVIDLATAFMVTLISILRG